MARQVCFDVDPSLPAVARAVSLALALLKRARVCRIADLGGTIPPDVWLDAGQLALLNGHLDVLGYIRATGVCRDGAQTPTVTVAVCPDCGRWQLVAGPAPARCQLTSGCAGVPVKAPVARRRADPPVPHTVGA